MRHIIFNIFDRNEGHSHDLNHLPHGSPEMWGLGTL